MGTYPDTPLTAARQRRDEARRLLANGIDPGEHRKLTKNKPPQDADSFEAVAREWHAKFAPTWTKEHAARILQRLCAERVPLDRCSACWPDHRTRAAGRAAPYRGPRPA